MTVHVTVPLDEAEKAELERIAGREKLSVEALIKRLVVQRFEYEAWFRAEVQKGRDAVARGEVIGDDEATAELEAYMAQREAKLG